MRGYRKRGWLLETLRLEFEQRFSLAESSLQSVFHGHFCYGLLLLCVYKLMYLCLYLYLILFLCYPR